MEKTKILYLIGGLGLGGSERQLFYVLENLYRSNFDCQVVTFTPYQDYFTNQLHEAGIKVWEIPADCKSIPKRTGYLFRLFREIRPQIVHSWTFHDNPYAGVVGWAAGIPIRFGSQRNEYRSNQIRKLPFFYRWLALYTVQKMVVNSERAKEQMIASGYPHARLVFVPNIVNLETTGAESKILRNMIATSEPITVIGTIGNLRIQKNQKMFVDVIARVCERVENVQGVIIGQTVGDEPSVLLDITQRISNRGLEDKVSYLGYQEEVPRLMSEISIFCLTSDFEGTPNVIMEAMAASKPVVATRVGGVPALVKDGVSGFLVEPGDVDGFADAVLELLENPDLAVRMGRAGRGIVEREYNSDKAVGILADLYLTALTKQ